MSHWGKIGYVIIFLSAHGEPTPDARLISALRFEHLPQKWTVLAVKNQTPAPAKVCVQGRCLPLSSRSGDWSLLHWPAPYQGDRAVLIQSNSQWALKTFEAGMLFDRTQAHLTKLRVPAAVMDSIKTNQEEVYVNRLREKELYKVATLRPWSTQWRNPVDTWITSPFESPRIPPGGKPYFHAGADFHAPLSTPVKACSDGMVLDEEKDPVYGNIVTLDHGKGLVSRYMHLSKFNVNIGDVVKGGDIIGYSGNTGRSEAPHLHWEMRFRGQAMDPVETGLLLEHLSYLE